MALRNVDSFPLTTMMMMVAVLLVAVATAAPSQEYEDDGALSGFEGRVRHLEKAWTKLDQQLQKGAENMDLLHKKLDRLERLMSVRQDSTNEKLESRAMHAQSAAERAALACNRLHHKLHPNSFNAQNVQTSYQTPRETPRTYYQTRNATQHQWYNKKENGYQVEKRPLVMQQDATSTFSKDASTITKITNMYNELWRRSMLLEGLAKDSISLTNATRRETQEGFRSMMQLTRRSMSTMAQPNNQICNIDQVVKTTNTMQHKLVDIDHNVNAKFEEIMMKQESQHQIQLNELNHLKNGVVNVLEKFSAVILNKTVTIFNALQNIQDFFKTHNTHVMIALYKINEAVETSTKDKKDLISESITTVSKNCHQQNNKNEELYQKLETVVASLQEYQEQQYTFSDQIEESELIPDVVEKNTQQSSTIDNTKILESISLLCKNKSQETNSVIDKLSQLIEKLHSSVMWFDEKNDIFENDFLDKESKESEVRLRHSKLRNITSTMELLKKLSEIKNEPSYEDSSTDRDADENKSRYPHQEPYGADFDMDLTTEGPKSKSTFGKSKKQRTFLTNNQIRGIYTNAETDDQNDYENDNIP